MTEVNEVPEAPPEHPEVPESVAADKYDRMMQLAAAFDVAGDDLRRRAGLGAEVLADPDVAETAELSTRTWREAENDVLLATSGRGGLLDRSLELDADALVVRATVHTYRWIDELQVVAERTLGAIAGRAVGYLAPEIALGGTIVSAGLIETDALDRDELAAYLNELAAANPELMAHFSSGGGGLLDRLRMRALLTVGSLGGPDGPPAAAGGLRAIGAGDFPVTAAAAFRDAAGGFDEAALTPPVPVATDGATDAGTGAGRPEGLAGLMTTLAATEQPRFERVGDARWIVYLPGRPARRDGVRLVGGDRSSSLPGAIRRIADTVEEGAHLLLVGSAGGGVTAAEVAALVGPGADFAVDQVVTVGAPSAQITAVPDGAPVLSLEDRADPVALLESTVEPPVGSHLTVVYDAGSAAGPAGYVVGGQACDAARHPEVVASLERLRTLGYLAG